MKKSVSLIDGRYTDTTGGSLAQDGGGVWSEVRGKVIGCIISNCSARNGGGVFGGEVKQSTFIDNSAIYGGGVYSSLVLACVFSNNSAASGGGLYACEVHSSWIEGNTATSDGGGAFGGLLRSCLILSNLAERGGGVYDAAVHNCTICNNYANDGGGCYGGRAVNSIVYYNSSSNFSSGAFHNCCTIPMPSGDYILTNKPGFNDRSEHDYTLRFDSLCCNAGSNAPWMIDCEDLNGRSRLVEGDVDLGAFEYSGFRVMHMPSYDQSNTWGVTVENTPTHIWLTGNFDVDQYPLTCRFDFGDGVSSSVISVPNSTASHYVGVTHAYTTTGLYCVTSTISFNAGATVTQQFTLSCRASNDYDATILHKIDNGLIWLYTNVMTSGSGYCWHHDGSGLTSYVSSANGIAVTAFAHCGHRASSQNYAYSQLMRGALEYLFANTVTSVNISPLHCNYDPDGNTNGIGLSVDSNKQMYEMGPIMSAIVLGGSPYDVVPGNAPANVALRSYADIIQDMADFCCWAQEDQVSCRGGWRYIAKEQADNSASVWPAIGLNRSLSWSTVVSSSYKDELGRWLEFSQSPTGGFGYRDSSDVTTLRTACGLCELASIGCSRTNSAITNAIAFVRSNFDADIEDLYGMNAMYEAFTMLNPELDFIVDRSWRHVFASAIVSNQFCDGYWNGKYTGTTIGKVFGTSAAISILSECSPWRIIAYSVNHSPENVSTNDDVSVEASVIFRPGYTNLSLTTWYRAATNDPFSSISMTNADSVFYTASAIPAQTNGTLVEYYVTALYSHDDTTITQRYPSAYTEDLFSYEVE